MGRYLDTRELQERLEELEEMRESYIRDNSQNHESEEESEEEFTRLSIEWSKDNVEEAEELEELISLRDEIGSEWKHGVTLIPEDDFEEYAKQLAEDLGMINESASWPNNCIDWERAARELQMDYSSTTFQGTEYLYRS